MQADAVTGQPVDPAFRAAAKQYILEQLTEENCDLIIQHIVSVLPRGVRYLAAAGLDAATPGALRVAIEAVL